MHNIAFPNIARYGFNQIRHGCVCVCIVCECFSLYNHPLPPLCAAEPNHAQRHRRILHITIQYIRHNSQSTIEYTCTAETYKLSIYVYIRTCIDVPPSTKIRFQSVLVSREAMQTRVQRIARMSGIYYNRTSLQNRCTLYMLYIRALYTMRILHDVRLMRAYAYIFSTDAQRRRRQRQRQRRLFRRNRIFGDGSLHDAASRLEFVTFLACACAYR